MVDYKFTFIAIITKQFFDSIKFDASCLDTEGIFFQGYIYSASMLILFANKSIHIN